MSSTPTPNDLTRQQLDELDALLQRMLSIPLPQPPVPTPTPPAPAPVAPVSAPSALVPPPANWRVDPPAPLRRPFVTEEIPAREPEPEVATTAPLFVPVAASSAPTIESFSSLTPMPVSTPAIFPLPKVEMEPALPSPAQLPALVPEPEPDPAPISPPISKPTSHLETMSFDPAPIPEPESLTGTLRGVDAPALPANFQSVMNSLGLTEPFSDPVEPEPVSLTIPEAPAEREREPGVPVFLWPLFAVNWMIETLLGLLGPVGQLLTHPVSKQFLGWGGMLLLAAAGAWSAQGMGWIRLPIPR